MSSSSSVPVIETLKKLVEKWEEAATWEYNNSNREYASALDQCANELADALTAERRPAERRCDLKADLVRVMTDRCVDRSCEGGDTDSAQANSSEQCRDYYGPSRVDDWCDMCLFNEAIKLLELPELAAERRPVEPETDLHQQIMNITCVAAFTSEAERAAYKLGHRDARHAAAEIVAAPPRQGAQDRQGE